MDNITQYSTANYSNRSIASSSIVEKNTFILILSILVSFVMLVGFIGNLLIIYVVSNYSRLKTVTNTYLLHLAISDLVFLSGVPFFIFSINTRSWMFGSVICKLFFLTQGVNQYTSIIILAFLSFDRFLAVCHSPKSIRWRSRVNPNILLIVTWLFSFLLMLPIIIFTQLDRTDPSNVQCIIILPLPKSRLLYLIFVTYSATMTFFLPLLFMIYFYVKIVYRLQSKIPKQHRRSRTSIRTRRKVTVLVLSVISVHLVCCLPYWTFQMFTTSELLPQTSRLLIPTSSITQFLLFVNSSTNPILYAFISEIFRLSFRRVFRCCLTTDENQYIHGKTTVKRNTTATNRKNLHPQRRTRGSTRIVSGTHHPLENCRVKGNQRLSVQTNPDLLNRQNRLLSLAPTTSIFNSETSFVSDM